MALKNQTQQLTLRFDLRIVCIVLIVIIAGMLALWRPWTGAASGTERKITIRGEATISSEPDQFTFNPMYERGTVDEVASLSTELTAKLKELGVEERHIKVNASAYDTYIPERMSGEKPVTNTLSLTIIVTDEQQAQKVQDYLLTTNPKGAISPMATFSDERRKSLEDEARTEAIADARQRAEQTAETLKSKIGKVIEVKEGANYGIMPYLTDTFAASPSSEGNSRSSLPVQPGENDFNYAVEVIFELK